MKRKGAKKNKTGTYFQDSFSHNVRKELSYKWCHWFSSFVLEPVRTKEKVRWRAEEARRGVGRGESTIRGKCRGAQTTQVCAHSKYPTPVWAQWVRPSFSVGLSYLCLYPSVPTWSALSCSSQVRVSEYLHRYVCGLDQTNFTWVSVDSPKKQHHTD